MFEKTLQDVVKGIRANKRDPSDFISTTIADIKVELKSSDAFIKAQAVRKLTYLQMLGYDMSWAAFYVVEVMTMPRFAHKRVGYLAANQCFTEDTEVVLLCTNHLQKEFKSPNPYDVGLAINCLANIATPGLSRDLISDLVQLLGSHKPYVRKKSLLAMYKLFIKYPQGLRLTFDRIKERLEDSDPSVVSCAVNVICELADKNPKNYLAMAPQFFRLLTTSSNNWMLIKVVKLLGSLVPEEPRLARKLLEPLATIIQNTAAKSLLYECIHTMTLALPFTRKADGTESKAVPAAVRLCSDHLRKFTQDPDQNLKYLGLVGFVNLMRSHPRAVADHRALVLACLSDDDVTIRTRALELLSGMVTKRNLEDLVLNLLEHVARAEGSYRDELIAKIIFVCSRDKYAYLSNFRWYTGVLVDLSHVEGSKHGSALALQLMDVSLRVEDVREYAVHKSVGLLLDPSLLAGRSSSTMQQVLQAAAWIVGEYCRPHLETLAKNQRRGPRVWHDVLHALLAPEASSLPAHTQGVYMQNASKVLIAMCQACSDDGELGRALEMIPGRLRALMRSSYIEVQERATTFYHLLVAYGITKEVIEDDEHAFLPGEGRTRAGKGSKSHAVAGQDESDGDTDGGRSGTAEATRARAKKGVPNGKASPPEVLDLLGLDPHPMGLADGNGPAVANGDGSAAGEEGAKVPMLTELALAPSMLGPVAAARSAATQLAALTAEVLKPVNQRAQSRVPPPDDVDLNRAVNSSELDRLLALEDDGPSDLSRLSFTQVQVPKSEYEQHRSFAYNRERERDGGEDNKRASSKKSRKKDKHSRDSRRDSGRQANGSLAGGRGGGGGGGLGDGDGETSDASLGSPAAARLDNRHKSDPFYLPPGGGRDEGFGSGPAGAGKRSFPPYSGGGTGGSRSSSPPAAPMSTALVLRKGDSYDDEYGDASGRSSTAAGRGRRDKDKGRRRSSRGGAGAGGGEAVDTLELMPASAVMDSDSGDEPAGGGGGSGSRRRAANGSARGSSSGLAAIDITTPLGENEVMPEVKPYVRLTAETAGAGRPPEAATSGGRAPAKDKREARSRKSRSSREKLRKDDAPPSASSASKKQHRSSKRSSASSGRHERQPQQQQQQASTSDFDLIGWGTGTPASEASAGAGTVDPSLLLPDATTALAPALASSGRAMKASPASPSIETWESDLSAILSAAAPIAAPSAPGVSGVSVAPAAAVAAPLPAASGLLADASGMDGSGTGPHGGGSGGGMVMERKGDDGRRRKSGKESASNKQRKERSSKKSASSSKAPKEKKRSRRTDSRA